MTKMPTESCPVKETICVLQKHNGSVALKEKFSYHINGGRVALRDIDKKEEGAALAESKQPFSVE